MPKGQSSGKGTSNRGFAAMDEEKQREIASKGGKAAHEKGTAHEFSHEEAVAAGRKGGQARGGSTSRGKSEGGKKGGSR
jgi:general stress protein YciG